jgi:hypothetical protein
MALALVRSAEQVGERIVLDVDTGTNPLYRVLLGREVRRDQAETVLDDVFWASSWQRNAKAGHHLDTRVEVVVPAHVAEPRCLLQVVTAKDGPRALARSRPRRLAVVPGLGSGGEELAMMTAGAAGAASAAGAGGALPGARPFAVPSMVGVRSAQQAHSTPASVQDLLGSLVQAALPAVQRLLAGGSTAPAGGAGTPGAGAPAPAGQDQLSAVIAAILRALVAPAGGPPMSGTASLGSNRFAARRSHPFIFGIDDALLAALAGPVLSSVAGPLLQALPQLVNSANQQRLESRQADYQMISQLIAGMDRARLADRLAALGAGQPAGAAATPPELGALLDLLRTASAPGAPGATSQPAAPAPPPPTVPGAAAPGAAAPAPTAPTPTAPALTAPGAAAPGAGLVRPGTLRVGRPFGSTGAGAGLLPSRAVLVPVLAAPVSWSGQSRAVFVRDRAMVLRFRLEVGASGPTSALPRAILRLVVRRRGGGDLLAREERLTGVAPGGEVSVSIDPAELAALPVDTELEVFAQLRWPSAHGSRQATSSATVVLTGGRFVVAAGAPVGDPVELTDMVRYRAFWNKVWSSPAPTEDAPLWGIDVTLRYAVVLTDSPAGNALMDVRARGEAAAGGLRAVTNGRMRSGIEVSVHELAALRTLWGGEPLDEATIAAFAAPTWLASQGGDAQVQVRFDGRRHARGLAWVVPVPSLRSFTVARPLEVDPFGQVVSTTSQEVAFPVLEAIRVIGLTSVQSPSADADADADADTDGDTGATGTAYAFEGHRVVLDTKVGLIPVRPMAAAPGPGSGPATAGPAPAGPAPAPVRADVGAAT